MTQAPGRQAVAPRRGIDRTLAFFVAGAVILIIAGLIAIPLASRRAAPLAPPNTPEGTVQRFYQALEQDDYAAAYDLLSVEAKGKLSPAEFRQQLRDTLRQTQVRTREVAIHDTTATVEVSLTSYSSGDLFGSGEYSYEREVTLAREGDSWKISSGPFYLPVE